MPRIDRRTICSGLLLIGRVAQNVVKRAVVAGGAEVEFVDGVARAISRVIRGSSIRGSITRGWITRRWSSRAIGITGVRRLRHPDANEAHANGIAAQPKGFDTPFSIIDCSLGKCL